MRPTHHCPIWDDHAYPPALAGLPDIRIVHRHLCETIEFHCNPALCLTRLAAARSRLRQASHRELYFAGICRNIAAIYQRQLQESALSRMVDELWSG